MEGKLVHSRVTATLSSRHTEGGGLSRIWIALELSWKLLEMAPWKFLAMECRCYSPNTRNGISLCSSFGWTRGRIIPNAILFRNKNGGRKLEWPIKQAGPISQPIGIDKVLFWLIPNPQMATLEEVFLDSVPDCLCSTFGSAPTGLEYWVVP